MLLAAALRGKAGAVAAIASHAMWQKEARVLELKMARWQVEDQVELVLRYLYRAKHADGRRLFHHVPERC